MFTRHLYEADEVIAALKWCMRQGRIQEALFWCLELIESEMEDTLKDTLYSCWLWYFGISRLSALSSLHQENYLEFVYGCTRLAKESRDRSILVLLLYATIDQEIPDRPSFFPCLQPLFEKENCSDLEKAFLSSVYQGKSRLAFDLSRPLWQENSSRVFELLNQLQLLKHNNSSLAECLTLLEFQPEEVWGSRACAVAAVCLNKKGLVHSLKPLETQLSEPLLKTIQEWKTLIGRRKRRIYPIPYECLYKITERGSQSNKETTLHKLYTLSDQTLMGCPFWNRVLEEEVPWLDDERKESFYELYFPDDIPDEWSKEDQEKSHGWCCLINNEVPNHKKYIERWFRNITSRTYWFLDRDLQRFIQEKEWQEVLDQPIREIVSTWCLTPVKKRILVVESNT
jgi:hypothetical protein